MRLAVSVLLLCLMAFVGLSSAELHFGDAASSSLNVIRTVRQGRRYGGRRGPVDINRETIRINPRTGQETITDVNKFIPGRRG